VLRTLRHTRLYALLALVIVAGSVPVSISALFHEADDAACQLVVVQHDESVHRVGGARPGRPVPQHCVLCHWLHSLQTIVAFDSVALPPTAVAHLAISSSPVVAIQACGEIPERAPPHAQL
jgi:hypothetical protein